MTDETKPRTEAWWFYVLMIIVSVAILVGLPFACGACGGLFARGYEAVQP